MTIGNPTRPNDAPLRSDAPLSGLTQTRVRRRAAYGVGAGSGAEALAGIAAIALAIIGLAGVLPFVCAAVAALVVGGALLLEGIALASAYAEEARHALVPNDRHSESMIGADMSAQALGGAAGVTLGILALTGVAPWTLLSIAALVFGGTMLLGGPSRSELVRDEVLTAGDPTAAAPGTREVVHTSAGAMTLAGLATLALGILSLLKIGDAHTLVLVAYLVAGAASLLSGTALFGRMATALR